MAVRSVLIPTTNIWDVGELQSVNVNSQEFKELLIRLYQNINNIALAVNAKENSYYITDEFVNNQMYFPNPLLNSTTQQTPTVRPVYRKVINFGALPNTATKSVAHNVKCTAKTTFTRIYGCASDTVAETYIPLPFASPVLAENIKLDVDSTNVNVTTGSNRSSYTTTYIIIEYLQQ